MNNLEVALSAFTAIAAGVASLTAVKTLLDARKKSLEDFLKKRDSRREIQTNKIKQ